MSAASRPDRTRRALLDAAADLLSRDTRASLADVATAAGVGRTTLHRYFATREDLLHALVDEAVGCIADAIADGRPQDGATVPALARVIDRLVELGPYVRFLMADPSVYHSDDLGRRWYEAFEPVAAAVQNGQAVGALRADLSVEWIVDLLGGAVVTAWDSVHDGRLAAREASDVVTRSLFSGIALDEGEVSR
jgi:AcrR family transcriptional regulator